MSRRVIVVTSFCLVLAAAVAGLMLRISPFFAKVSRVRDILRPSAEQIRSRIDGLDLSRAQEWLAHYRLDPSEGAILRARLALYRGDCDEARAIIGADANVTRSARELASVAEACARSMAAATVINDRTRSLWLRMQDDADAVWAPLVMDAATQARALIADKLGVPAAIPLRIELVMDHASLSALTGLPIEAAETTGTVAVARFGRVTLLSPRAFKKGYPWQDTLAHEITHLMVTAATNDAAPLWLQEALAKHLETAWRAPRPHDGVPNQHEIARTAWLQGQSVGFERLGASIALLPNPEAANIAYAEVYDFLDVVIRNSGWSAVRLLLHEIRDLGGERTDAALRSATGYSIEEWTRRWRHDLIQDSRGPRDGAHHETPIAEYLEMSRSLRLAELFDSIGRYDAVKSVTAASLDQTAVTELRTLAGLAQLEQGDASAAIAALGQVATLNNIEGDWLALSGRALAELGRTADARSYLSWALAYAPTEERVACEGFVPSRNQGDGKLGSALCSAASSLARSAREPREP